MRVCGRNIFHWCIQHGILRRVLSFSHIGCNRSHLLNSLFKRSDNSLQSSIFGIFQHPFPHELVRDAKYIIRMNVKKRITSAAERAECGELAKADGGGMGSRNY